MGDGGAASCVLLTGATGFLGAHLLCELLREARAQKVVCLVRKGSEEAAERLVAVCKQYKLDVDWDRVVTLEADVAEERFGLGEAAYSKLSAQVGSIVHCAAAINAAAGYEQHKPCNVRGTANVLRFATHSHAALVHVSTMGIANTSSERGANSVALVPAQVLATLGGYAQSKWVAEKLVVRALERGLPGVVVRVPVLLPSKTSCVCNPKDATVKLVRGLKLLRAATLGTHLPQSFRFMHVDDAAVVLARIWAAHSSVCGGVQVASLVGTWVSQDKFVEALVKATKDQEGGSVRVLPEPEFVGLVEQCVTTSNHPLALYKGAIISGFLDAATEDHSTFAVDCATHGALACAKLPKDVVMNSITEESLVAVLRAI